MGPRPCQRICPGLLDPTKWTPQPANSTAAVRLRCLLSPSLSPLQKYGLDRVRLAIELIDYESTTCITVHNCTNTVSFCIRY